jgi:hypothetical protein
LEALQRSHTHGVNGAVSEIGGAHRSTEGTHCDKKRMSQLCAVGRCTLSNSLQHTLTNVLHCQAAAVMLAGGCCLLAMLFDCGFASAAVAYDNSP